MGWSCAARLLCRAVNEKPAQITGMILCCDRRRPRANGTALERHLLYQCVVYEKFGGCMQLAAAAAWPPGGGWQPTTNAGHEADYLVNFGCLICCGFRNHRLSLVVACPLPRRQSSLPSKINLATSYGSLSPPHCSVPQRRW